MSRSTAIPLTMLLASRLALPAFALDALEPSSPPKISTAAPSNHVSSSLQPPDVPTGLAATSISSDTVSLSWTASSGTVTSYQVYRATYPFTATTAPTVFSACGSVPPETSCTSSPLGPNTYWAVTASNDDGTSAVSGLVNGP